MMNYEIFKEVVKEKFMDYMPEKFKGMELVAEPVEKVNVTLDGIILREEGRNISPTIYINDMYKKYPEKLPDKSCIPEHWRNVPDRRLS